MTDETPENDVTTSARRIAAAAIGTALVVVLYYALDRARMAILHPSMDPSMIIAGERIEYFWRVTVCGYLSPLIFFALYRISTGREDRALRMTVRAIVPVAIIGCVLSVFFP